MCNWAHQYIERSDSIGSNISLRTKLVFFAVCQAIFYCVIAFRSKDLTEDKPSINAKFPIFHLKKNKKKALELIKIKYFSVI